MNELIQNLNTKYNTALNKYGIDTQLKRTYFWSQFYYESKLIPQAENLNYSAKELDSTFLKYFSLNLANQYVHQPAKIANRVYAYRMGNGNVESDDGFLYRKFIQLTGKDNYKAFASYLKNDKILTDNLIFAFG
ncbi:hypothetical protein [Flavobacterium sp. KJJ]|uniref:hypothetical protein n=1 Tax=Flavobacterium sp. KJJ TaxID=1270193 RepID=UPI000692344B|nr:hypothetical protein [Flavobacterium sp. KJJ]